MNEGITLYDLQKRVKGCLESGFPHSYWVKGEISAVKTNYSGHCYIDLIDKDDSGADVRAKGHAIVWNSSWKVLRPYFVGATGRELSVGMNVLVKAQVQYSELYGLSLIVYDIDPSFTVGEAELRRREVINRLREEGMFDMNSTLELPALPRSFAVVSSETAAGYRDFMKHLHENSFGFKFHTKLYSAPMQGGAAPAGIVEALDGVMEDVEGGTESFDAVLILRGGGSAVDLSCFDDYDLCANVAQFPLPVMVAVGHDQDYHICDMVASTSVKTPTALADFILDIFAQEEAMLSSLSSRLAMALNNKFSVENSRLQVLHRSLVHKLEHFFVVRANTLDLLEQRVNRGDPATLLQGGYCVAEVGGERVVSVRQVQCGSKLNLLLKDGCLECRVEHMECKS